MAAIEVAIYFWKKDAPDVALGALVIMIATLEYFCV